MARAHPNNVFDLGTSLGRLLPHPLSLRSLRDSLLPELPRDHAGHTVLGFSQPRAFNPVPLSTCKRNSLTRPIFAFPSIRLLLPNTQHHSDAPDPSSDDIAAALC